MARDFGMIDICFIFTPIHKMLVNRLEPPLGILYLATYLKEHGYHVAVRDLDGLEEARWDIPVARHYGFTTYTTTYHETLRVRHAARRKNPYAFLIAGGPHATALPREVARDFHYVIVGEGEQAMLELLSDGAKSDIIIGEPVRDLDALPYPDYSLVEVDTYKRVVNNKKAFSVQSSRGCPYRCLFCNSNIMGAHKPVRFRSPQHVVGEMVQLLEQYGDISFRFQDDIFGLKMSWLREFTRLVKPLNVDYRAFVRATQCRKKEFVDLLVEGGCKHVALGIESGCDKILLNMKKDQTAEDCAEAIANAKEAGLVVRIYLIVGFPGETWKTVRETVQFVKDTRPHEFAAYPLIPYPGTPLYHAPDVHGILNLDVDYDRFYQVYGDKQAHFQYDLEHADRSELQVMKDYLEKELEEMGLSWYHESKRFHAISAT